MRHGLLIALPILLINGTAPADPTKAQDGYVGGDLGATMLDDGGAFASFDQDYTDLGFDVIGIYTFFRHFSVEGRYTDLVHSRLKGPHSMLQSYPHMPCDYFPSEAAVGDYLDNTGAVRWTLHFQVDHQKTKPSVRLESACAFLRPRTSRLRNNWMPMPIKKRLWAQLMTSASPRPRSLFNTSARHEKS